METGREIEGGGKQKNSTNTYLMLTYMVEQLISPASLHMPDIPSTSLFCPQWPE